MSKNSKFYIVEASALPEIFLKVAQARELIQTGEAKTVNEATHIPVLVKRAAADAHHPGRLAHGGRLAHLEHPAGLRHLYEYLRQGFCRYDVILLIAHGRKPPLMCPAETRPRRFFWPLSYHVV